MYLINHLFISNVSTSSIMCFNNYIFHVGVPRETEDELKFADFSIFSDPKKCYSIFNFKYPNRQFDRLSQLMEFNILNNIDVIRENIRTVTLRKTKNLVPPSTSTILKDPPEKEIADHPKEL